MLDNHLLAALPAEDYQRLIPHLEAVSLPLYKVLYEAGEPIDYVYFPNRAMVSLVTTMEDGTTVEVGLVGKEGMVGIPVVLGGETRATRAFVQVPGDGMKLAANRLKAEFSRGGVLQSLLLRYIQTLFTQVSQSAACNRLHNLEERLARWLLLTGDALQLDEFPLTQEFMAQMLGVRRSGVTVAASTLQRAGIIRYSRGKISILSREALEAASCECYRVIKNEADRLLSNYRKDV